MVTKEQHEILLRNYTKAFISLQVFKSKYTVHNPGSEYPEFTFPTDMGELTLMLKLENELRIAGQKMNEAKNDL